MTNDEYRALLLNFEERPQFVIRHSNYSSFNWKGQKKRANGLKNH